MNSHEDTVGGEAIVTLFLPCVSKVWRNIAQKSGVVILIG